MILPAAEISAVDERNVSSNIVGFAAPKWEVGDWINSEPLTLEGLRGKVILVRWWTGPGCPYCTPSVLILNDLYKLHKDKGLVVIGFYHHKSDEPIKLRNVRRLAKKMKMDFPIAIDPEWQTLKRYWFDRTSDEERWTSVSFLIDQQGIVRYVHPGVTITSDDSKEIETKILNLLMHKEAGNERR